MEKLRPTHILETQNKDLLKAQTESSEADPYREEIQQTSEYDPTEENHPEQIRIREYLNSINESALKEIFQEYFRRAGSDNDTITWVPIDSVRIELESQANVDAQTSTTGYYRNEDGIVLIANPNKPHKLQQIVWDLIHEELHAVSTTNSVTYNEDATKERTIRNAGVSFSTHVQEQLENEEQSHYAYKLFTNINEGITESITDQIFQEYITRTGEERISKAEAEQYSDRQYVFAPYGKYQKFLDTYILLLAAQSETPSDTVRDSIYRTYLRNGEIVPEEIFDHVPEEKIEQVHGLMDMILEGDGNFMNLLSACIELGIMTQKQGQNFADSYMEYLDIEIDRIKNAKQ